MLPKIAPYSDTGLRVSPDARTGSAYGAGFVPQLERSLRCSGKPSGAIQGSRLLVQT